MFRLWSAINERRGGREPWWFPPGGYFAVHNVRHSRYIINLDAWRRV